MGVALRPQGHVRKDACPQSQVNPCGRTFVRTEPVLTGIPLWTQGTRVGGSWRGATFRPIALVLAEHRPLIGSGTGAACAGMP